MTKADRMAVESRQSVIDRLIKKTELDESQRVIDVGLRMLEWAVEQYLVDRRVVAIDENDEPVEQLVMPKVVPLKVDR